jgi:FSR family fosmidomycin resistance protein-like MFS transporter
VGSRRSPAGTPASTSCRAPSRLQGCLPARIGVASGLLLGASAGVGGGVAALLGVLADAAGLRAVLLVLAAIPLAELALALGLPREEASAS